MRDDGASRAGELRLEHLRVGAVAGWRVVRSARRGLAPQPSRWVIAKMRHPIADLGATPRRPREASPGSVRAANWTESRGTHPLRILAIVVAVVIALAASAAVAVLLTVDPNAYRGQIERLAERKTGRPLQIGGDIHLRLFRYLALSIEDVHLGNPRGYGQSAFLSVRRDPPVAYPAQRLEVSRIVSTD